VLHLLDVIVDRHAGRAQLREHRVEVSHAVVHHRLLFA
jgi:hypothetical protein